LSIWERLQFAALSKVLEIRGNLKGSRNEAMERKIYIVVSRRIRKEETQCSIVSYFLTVK
jgi:hypothetical protein